MSQNLQERNQVVRPERTVQPQGKNIGMRHRSQKGLHRLAGKRTSALVRHRNRQHERHSASGGLHGRFRRINSGLGIQRVENSFDEQGIHTAFEQGFHLFPIGSHQFVESQGAVCRIVHIGTHRAGFVGRSHRTGHETRFFGIEGRELIRKLAGYPASRQIDFTTIVLHVVIRHRYSLRTERIRLDNVRPGREIFTVDIPNHIGTRQRQQIVVTGHQSRNIPETPPPEISLRQAIPLNHGAHGTIQYQYPLLNNLFQPHDFKL